MKFLAIIICFYVNALAVIPTVKVVQMTMEVKCHDACCGKAKEGIPNGCQKEKCLLNLNFNTSPFLVFDAGFKLQNAFSNFSKKEKIHYNTVLIPNYRVVIWQPPEYVLNS